MKQNIAKILKEVLKLPPEARAALAGTLLDNLDPGNLVARVRTSFCAEKDLIFVIKWA